MENVNDASVFSDKFLEIAITTYNRPLFIVAWLQYCFGNVKKRNIALTVYDSSPNSETEKVIDDFNKNNNNYIKYVHVDSNTIIGYKPMVAILNSDCKYVWVSGDSRYQDFDEFDKKIFPILKQEIDFLVFFDDLVGLVDTDYSDKSKFLHECFIPCTCIGCSIYRTDIFSHMKNDATVKFHYDDLFSKNYGFAWLGYFYSAFADSPDYRAAYRKVHIYNVFPKKKQAWAKKFYECWIDDLCQITDNLPVIYENTETVCRESWDSMKLYSFYYCFTAKLYGDLSKKNYERYVETGLIQRISQDKIGRIKFFAYSPKWLIKILYLFYRIFNFSKRVLLKS